MNFSSSNRKTPYFLVFFISRKIKMLTLGLLLLHSTILAIENNYSDENQKRISALIELLEDSDDVTDSKIFDEIVSFGDEASTQLLTALMMGNPNYSFQLMTILNELPSLERNRAYTEFLSRHYINSTIDENKITIIDVIRTLSKNEYVQAIPILSKLAIPDEIISEVSFEARCSLSYFDHTPWRRPVSDFLQLGPSVIKEYENPEYENIRQIFIAIAGQGFSKVYGDLELAEINLIKAEKSKSKMIHLNYSSYPEFMRSSDDDIISQFKGALDTWLLEVFQYKKDSAVFLAFDLCGMHCSTIYVGKVIRVNGYWILEKWEIAYQS